MDDFLSENEACTQLTACDVVQDYDNFSKTYNGLCMTGHHFLEDCAFPWVRSVYRLTLDLIANIHSKI